MFSSIWYISKLMWTPKLVTTIRSLAAAGCSLSTFSLTLTYYADHGAKTYTKPPFCEDLPKHIPVLMVECKMTIQAKAYDRNYTTRFNYMANYLGLIKQWAITEDVSVAEPCHERTLHIREWVLRPADASTIDKVPSSDEVDEIYRRLI